MKVVAINGSPKGSRSNTAVMIQALLNGFSSTGSDTSQIYLADKDIGYCSGCYSCWTKTPGLCVHKDDMRAIISEMKGANYLIFGTPLFLNNISGTLKVFFDRLTAAGGDPTNKTTAAAKDKAPGYIMVSNCGYPNGTQFDIVSSWINRVAIMTSAHMAAEFYTADGKTLTSPTQEQVECKSRYLSFLTDCGKELSVKMELNEAQKALLSKGILEF